MRLYKRDVEFLLLNLQNETLKSKLRACSTDDPKGRPINLIFDAIELDALEDELTDLLTYVGIDENDEVNATGVYLENLVDLIRNEYQ